MTNKLFVTKLSYKTTDKTLAVHFESYGKLIWCQVGPAGPEQTERPASSHPSTACLSVCRLTGHEEPGGKASLNPHSPLWLLCVVLAGGERPFDGGEQALRVRAVRVGRRCREGARGAPGRHGKEEEGGTQWRATRRRRG